MIPFQDEELNSHFIGALEERPHRKMNGELLVLP
jgi:hypothetical protein